MAYPLITNSPIRWKSPLWPVVASLFVLVAACSSGSGTKPVDVGRFSVRSFPVELENDSPQIPRDRVIEIYRSYLGDARLTPATAVESREAHAMTDYCANFRGKVIHDQTIPGATFSWSIDQLPGQKWNEVTLFVKMDDPQVPAKIGFEEGETITFNWNKNTLNTTAVFGRPGCGL